jgi:hypothetical protein
MIKTHLEEAVRKIELDKERAVAQAKERVTREQIVPFNAEIDKARDAAISQKQNSLNEQIKAHQETFAQERQSFIEAAEKKKNDNANAVLATEVAIVTAEYDRHLAKLRAQIDDVKE